MCIGVLVMDLVGSILLGLAGGVATGAGEGLYHWLKKSVTDLFKDQGETKIVAALEEIGNLADADIRKRVAEFAREKKLAPDQAEELTGLLINLARGTRFHSTQGTPQSGFLRCERLLDQLLS